MENVKSVDFLKGVDNLIEMLKSTKSELAHIWCTMNAREATEFTKEEQLKIMEVIESAITKEYCLVVWGIEQDLPKASRVDYWKDYREKRKAILSKLLV